MLPRLLGPPDKETSMPGPPRRRYTARVALALALAPLSVAACGDDGKDKSSKATTMSITTTDLGKKKFRMEAPKSIEGGVVTVNFRNAGKVRHEAQLIRLDGGHTVNEALKIVSADKPVIPDWLHAEGGVAAMPPGASGTATVKLAAGNYAVIDTESDNGPPPAVYGAKASFKVTGDNGGEIEDTDTKVEAKEKGHDKYEWVVSNLKPGTNELTFDNTGKEIHHMVAAPILGKATLADVKKTLSEEKPSGPPPLDFKKITGISVLDGKKKEITRLKLSKGRNALICFLTDRDGKGKPHFQEGMLKEVDVK
jgi:uncharacterized cupredoxin-like copper-binding protein